MQVGNSTKFSGKGGKKLFLRVTLAPLVLLLRKAAELHLHHTCLTEGSTHLEGAERNQKLPLHARTMITQ
jgi:hypothetical protein